MKWATCSLVLALLCIGWWAEGADGAVIASSDFDDRTVSGATASNLTWMVNGVANPGEMQAMDETSGLSEPLALFDTVDAQGKFAVDRNIASGGPRSEGFWYVDVQLDVGPAPLDLSSASLDAYIFSNKGLLQPKNRDLDMSVELLNASNTLMAEDTQLDIFPDNDSEPVQPQFVRFDLSSASLLSANSDYFLRIRVFSDGTNGNNAGFDNLVIHGEVVPEPATFGIWSLLVGCTLIGIRRRWRHPR